jgi:hypothetical protein
MSWVDAGLSVICLGLAVLHLLRLAVRRRDVVAELSHTAMALGMAAMFAPFADPVPQPVWFAVFVVCAAWFAALALRSGRLGGEAPHHVVGSATMLFMLAAGHGAPAADGSAHAGHIAHGGGAADTLGLTSVAAIVLTAYFAWHALRCADRCRPVEVPDAPASAVAVRTSVRSLSIHGPQVAAGAHMVMAALMASMLLGMV